MAEIGPKVIITLGTTALKAIMGERLAIVAARERTLEEHSDLLSRAGMKVIDVTAVGGGDGIIEAARRD